jgi:hypothetical protein
MAAGSVSVDTLLADAISKMDGLVKRMDALETGEGHKNPIKGDAKKADDDDDDRKDSAKADDDDDDKKDDAVAPKKRILDDDKKDDGFSVKKGDDGELEIKHEPEDKKSDKKKKSDSAKADSKKADSKKADAKKADAKKADDDDDKRDDDDDDKKADDDDDKKADDDDDKKDDAAKADSTELRRMLSDQQQTIRRLEALMKPKSDDEHVAFADAQARADAVFNGFGQRAPRPLEGEALFDYRKRLATKLKSYSPAWKGVKFSMLPEEAFNIAETQVYSDATAAASNPTDLNAGELRMVTKIDPTTGVRSNVFYGKESFVKAMGRPGRRVASFRTLASQ